MQDQYDEGMTLQDLLRILLNKWYYIVFSVFICFTLAAIYSYHFTNDFYVAESSMIVQVNSQQGSNYTNIMAGENLVETYTEIATSHNAIQQLIDNLDLSLTYQDIIQMISVHGISNTLIVELSVTSTNKVLATDIANELIVIVQDLSQSYKGLESVEILDIALEPVNPAGPNRVLNMIIGFLLGIILGCAIIFVVELFDNKFKTEKDIETHLNLRVLGLIPDYLTPEGELKQ